MNDFLLQIDRDFSKNETDNIQEEQYQLHLETAKILARFGCYHKALLSINQAIIVQPGRTQTWIFRGNMLLYLERYEAALSSFQQALKIQPDHQAAVFFCSVAFYHLGQPRQAYLIYRQALEIGQQPKCQKLTQIFNFDLFRFHELL
ncbi:MAG: tetratricopeptide repeat protein [Microcoleaceae cyanobacterium]